MSFKTLISTSVDKKNFLILSDYIDFACSYLDEFDSFQAEIVCQNETKYRFWQYKEDGNFNITRPINAEMMYGACDRQILEVDFLETLENVRDLPEDALAQREIICNSIYTIQQCIGAALDGLPSGLSNTARKVNGDLFERFIRLIVVYLGINCESAEVKIPIKVNGIEQCKMKYQHDLVIKFGDVVKAIGSVKTSSKDRIDKIFIDKFLFTQITGTNIPHIAIFLNDVQRGKQKERSYKVSSTFLPGHFKGYSIKLNPLDGVYYCDPRPNMKTDPFLKERIKTIDHLLCCDLWSLLEASPGIEAEVEETEDI